MTLGNYLNKDVLALEMPRIGYVVRETDDKIIVYNGIMDRYDIPKSEIQNTGRGRNVLIGLPLYGIVHKYKVSRAEEEQQLPIISITERYTDRLGNYRTC
ncbi:MAG: hypothetical protein M3250_02500 [Thermoproteota archaeon]|jgi:hypothetical protein|nr:hypothetical protein [Thermoproteota archaeon]